MVIDYIRTCRVTVAPTQSVLNRRLTVLYLSQLRLDRASIFYDFCVSECMHHPLFLVISNSAVSCVERLVSEMTCCVLICI